MGSDYYDDEEEFDEEYDDEYEEDFETTGAEIKIRTALGMDAFAMIFSFFAIIAACVLIARFLLWEVYDLRVGGIMPKKIKPPINQKFKIVEFGCDEKLSHTYNYAIIDAGRAQGLEPGLVLYIGNKEVANVDDMKAMEATGTSDWGVCLVVTEEIEDNICRADIVRIKPPKKVGLFSAIRINETQGTDSQSNRWETLATLKSLTDNLNWLNRSEPIKATVASWNKNYQWIVKYVEETYSEMERKEPGE